MELLKNVSEYYEELFPVTQNQKKFYDRLKEKFSSPVKFLRINCGTGSLEHTLSKEGHDVTGIEIIPDLLESANRKRRTQLMFLRYFQMSTLEMVRFLGKKFYNVISILDNRISFIHDRTLMEKFFYDCHELISENGCLIINLFNYEKFCNKTEELPVKESIRSKLFTKLITDEAGNKYINQHLESGNGRRHCITEDARIFPLTKKEIQQYAQAAGFTRCNFYSDFDENEFTDQSDELLAVIS